MLSLLCGAAPIDLWRRWKKNPKKSETPFPLPSLINLASPPPPNRANPTPLRETERKEKERLQTFANKQNQKGKTGGERERAGRASERQRKEKGENGLTRSAFFPPPPSPPSQTPPGTSLSLPRRGNR